MKLPVIACSSGGPLETVHNEVTGFLCDSDPKAFGEAMFKFVKDPTLKGRLGQAGRQRVDEKFSFNSFTNSLHTTVTEVLKSGASDSSSTFRLVKLLFAAFIV